MEIFANVAKISLICLFTVFYHLLHLIDFFFQLIFV